MNRAKQRPLPFHGGPRASRGRPRGNRVSHAVRPRCERPTPVHVTLRVKRHVWNLRSGRCHRRLQACFERARGRFGARLVEYSVMGNHLHLIVEADHSQALARGMQGLCIRIAKALNALMRLAGRVFDDHYFSRLLRTPTELVRAIAYVLENHRHHFGSGGSDAYASSELPEPVRAALLAPPNSWLLREGWRRAAAVVAPRPGERAPHV